MWQDLAFHSRFSLVPSGYFPEMTCFALPDSDLWLLACLNSPLMWAWLWRNTIHGKDEVLRLKTTYTQNIPIASPTEKQHNAACRLVESIIQLSTENKELIDDFIYWLLLEFGVEQPGQQLESFAALNNEQFIKEVKSRRPRSASRLIPAEVRLLKTTHEKYGKKVRQVETTINQLETKLSDLVNQAYGLTDEEIAWLWKTAPPRMPTDPPASPRKLDNLY